MTGCVLDIGSNTIRAVVYEIIGERVNTVYNKGAKSMLFDCTVDSKLTRVGMEILSRTLAELCSAVKDYDCEFHAFATSAFRDLKNQQEVIEYIESNNELTIHVLSEEEEISCDYAALRPEVGAVRGMGIDLGGGSCQIFAFSEEGMTASASLKIGTKRLVREFVTGAMPTEQELKDMYKYVSEQLDTLVFLSSDRKRNMYAMGGSARAALVVKSVLKPDNKADRLSGQELADFIEFSLTAGAEQILRAIVKKRYLTSVAGMIVMHAIASRIGAENVIVKDCGVRLGYAYRYMV